MVTRRVGRVFRAQTVDKGLQLPIAMAAHHALDGAVLLEHIDQADVAEHGEGQGGQSLERLCEATGLGDDLGRCGEEGVGLGQLLLLGIEPGPFECLGQLARYRHQEVAFVWIYRTLWGIGHHRHAQTGVAKGDRHQPG